MEARRLRKRVCGILVESPPEWLPDGWTVEVRNTRHGNYRYYRSPAFGRTFRSKEEVFRHLSVIKHGDGTSGRASSSNESKKQLAEERKESVDWLPSGWILEIKTRRSGKSAGKAYKCYFEPSSGERFYSKGEVLRFLSSKKVHEQKHLNRNSTDNVIARIECSLDCSPHGWVKESEFKEGNGGLSKNLSPDSTEKRKSRPSEESVEAKPEEKNASESATLTPPSPHKTRERTPKNGRIPAKKCTRRSIISIEKADMEIEENIKPEKVTEDEASKGGEDEPESATKSMENSKEEDETMPRAERATGEFSLVSIDELKLVAERVKFLGSQNKNRSEMEKELPAAAAGNPSTPDLAKPKHGSRKTKAMNAISRPRRSSRRLASVEIDPATDVDMGGERPHGSKSENAATDLLGKPRENGEDGAANTAVSLQRPNTVEGGGTATMAMNRATSIDWADFSSPSPFGDSWSDPCLEFAFKTLTGDLPVLDDAMAIQEYFQQNLYLVDGSTSPDVLDPISNNKIAASADDDDEEEAEIKLASEQEMKGRCQLGVMEKK